MSSAHRRSAVSVTHTPSGLGLFAAVSIGVGGMIGAGSFSILGVVAGVSGTALPVSFVIGGVIALLAAYSYLKLGIRYPSVGGWRWCAKGKTALAFYATWRCSTDGVGRRGGRCSWCWTTAPATPARLAARPSMSAGDGWM